ncbi:hypothetical protein SDC9_134775 [bioreactor metagenome]|uniref:Uncharacterized protein n=1 Tax=bioreactor metagenome TaxID=1076179 RepID=A0A645DEN3_9ZZZZ
MELLRIISVHLVNATVTAAVEYAKFRFVVIQFGIKIIVAERKLKGVAQVGRYISPTVATTHNVINHRFGILVPRSRFFIMFNADNVFRTDRFNLFHTSLHAVDAKLHFATTCTRHRIA